MEVKDKINEGSKMIDKEVLDTQAQQRLLQGRMKDTVDLAKKELALEKKKIKTELSVLIFMFLKRIS